MRQQHLQSKALKPIKILEIYESLQNLKSNFSADSFNLFFFLEIDS